MTIEEILQRIAEEIYSNGEQKITGDYLQATLKYMAEALNTIAGSGAESLVNIEKQARINADNLLNQAIAAERSRAEGVEATKANTSEVNAALALKASKEYVDTELLKKATVAALQAEIDRALAAEALKANSSDVYTKAEVDKRVLYVNGMDKMSDYGIRSLSSLSRATGMVFIKNEGTIIPSVYEEVGWLYEYQEGWRLTHNLSGFVFTADATWVDLLAYMDEHSDRLVGSDRFDALLAQVTALRENTAAIARSGEEGQHNTSISDLLVGLGQLDNPTESPTLLIAGRDVYMWGIGGYDGGTDTTPVRQVIEDLTTRIENLVVIDEEEV